MLADITQLATGEGQDLVTLLLLPHYSVFFEPNPDQIQLAGWVREGEPWIPVSLLQWLSSPWLGWQLASTVPFTPVNPVKWCIAHCWLSQVSFPELGGHFSCLICSLPVGFFWAQGWNHHPSQFIPCANQLSLWMALEGGGAPQRDWAFKQALHVGPSEGLISEAEPCWNRQLGLCTLRRGCLAIHCPVELELSRHLQCSAFSVRAAMLYLSWGGLGLCMWLWYLARF